MFNLFFGRKQLLACFSALKILVWLTNSGYIEVSSELQRKLSLVFWRTGKTEYACFNEQLWLQLFKDAFLVDSMGARFEFTSVPKSEPPDYTENEEEEMPKRRKLDYGSSARDVRFDIKVRQDPFKTVSADVFL